MKSETRPVTSTRPSTVAEYVCSEIREAILAGRYALGSKLDQQSLAFEYEVSVIPVREALRQLEAEGLVRILPRRGAFVVELSPAEVKELFHLRSVLEAYAIELSAPRITASHLSRLYRLAETIEAATNDNDFEALLSLNREFHFAIYEAAESPLLIQILSGLWDRSSVYRRLHSQKPQHLRRFLVEHLKILRACESGDALAAKMLMKEHILRIGRDILHLLNSDSETEVAD